MSIGLNFHTSGRNASEKREFKDFSLRRFILKGKRDDSIIIFLVKDEEVFLNINNLRDTHPTFLEEVVPSVP